ncbi:MAG: hypothetical protein M3N29_05975 [Chloroflexota bacterium]|nr:hypothetical protein [Chloroflexota bacterium]
MNEQHFARSIRPWLEQTAAPRTPAYLDEMLGRSARARQRPAWLVSSWWLPSDAVTGGALAIHRAVLLALLILLTIVAVGLAGVGAQQILRDARPSRPIGTIETVATLPWQPQLLDVGADLAAWLDGECAAQIRQRFPEAMPVRTRIEVRGGGFVRAWYAEQGRPELRSGYCNALILAGHEPQALHQTWAPGYVRGPSTGSYIEPGIQEDLRPSVERPLSLDEFVPYPLSVTGGRVGEGVARVDVVLENGVRVEAALGENYIYTAWWPAEGEPGRWPKYRSPQYIQAVRHEAFDATGRLLTPAPLPTLAP